MKLLFDQQISYRVVRALQDIFPRAKHVKFYQLEYASDQSIWDFCKANGYTIVTKDDDFHQRSLALGHPPKVVWLKIGNCSREKLEVFIRERNAGILDFERKQEASLLVLHL